MEYKEAAAWVWDWQMRGDNFGRMLVHLIAKADPQNRGRLRLAYPVVVEAYEDWLQAESPTHFYRANNLPHF